MVVDAGNGTGGAWPCPSWRSWASRWSRSTARWTAAFPTTSRTRPSRRTSSSSGRRCSRRSAEVGIGYDGDADRIGVVDNEGGIIRGDYLMIIFAREIIERHRGATFVSEVKCSKNLFADIAKRGGQGRSCGRRATRSSSRR